PPARRAVRLGVLAPPLAGDDASAPKLVGARLRFALGRVALGAQRVHARPFALALLADRAILRARAMFAVIDPRSQGIANQLALSRCQSRRPLPPRRSRADTSRG